MGHMLKEPGSVHQNLSETPGAGYESPASPVSNSIPQAWRIWARELHRLRLDSWVAALLDGAGALTILGAQAIYVSQPLLNRALPDGHLNALARLLEEPEMARSFADYLREGDPS